MDSGPIGSYDEPVMSSTVKGRFLTPRFLEWLLPLLVQVLVAGPLHHPPLLTSQNMTSTTKSWVDR